MLLRTSTLAPRRLISNSGCIISSLPFLSPLYPSAPVRAMSSSSAKNVTVSIPESTSPHRVETPSFYRTSPPPHWESVSNGQPIKFIPPWESADANGDLLHFLKGRMTEWDEGPLPPPHELPKVNHIQWKELQSAVSKQEGDPTIRYTWIGHAGCHVQLPVPVAAQDGSIEYHPVTVLTDPVLSRRCSPVQFMGPERFTAPPTTVQSMADAGHGAWPDVVAISHNHYDHTDIATVKALADPPAGRTRPHFVVSRGTKTWFLSNTKLQDHEVTEMDWWDDRILSVPVGSSSARLRFTFVPAQHFSARGLTDRNATLWGGYVFQALPSSDGATGEKLARAYFVGDTGYRTVPRGLSREEEEALPHCPAFEEIGAALGPMDLSLIPIGAYKPRSMFSTIHVAPHESVKIHQAVHSKQSYGIHWGVFRLTSEDVDEPPRLLAESMEQEGLQTDDFTAIEIGQTVYVDINDK